MDSPENIICWSCQNTRPAGPDNCPDCQEPALELLQPAFTVDFGRARNLLDGAGLLVGQAEQSGVLGGLQAMGYVFESAANSRVLPVAAADRMQAIELLDKAGITLAGGGMIVDITELNCLECGAPLPAERAAGQSGQCAGCGMQFEWIDVSI
ncbi:MAG: hypothetical protein CMJ39_08600 [Phycisphaerae bacterium]|nr:hypothetical protein [Phycisphaerae bacterium]